MKLFACANSQNIPCFENFRYENCQSALGYRPGSNRMVALVPDGAGWRSITQGGETDQTLPALRFCANAEHAACNWLIAADDIMDTLEMAASFGVRLRPRLPGPEARAIAAELDFDPTFSGDFGAIIDAWLKLTYVANNLNRCMGSADLYPFTLTEAVFDKLGLIHALVRARQDS